MWNLIWIICSFLSIILLFLYRKSVNECYALYEKWIKELEESIADHQEVLSRNRQFLRSYKEENDRAWKAATIWETNYRELEKLYRRDAKKNPPEI